MFHSTYDNKRNLLGKLWKKGLNYAIYPLYPILIIGEFVLYPDDKYENMGNISESHPMRLTVSGVIVMAITALIFGPPCSTAALLILAATTALSVPAIIADTFVDAAKFWGKRYKDTCRKIFGAGVLLAAFPYYLLKQAHLTTSIAILASIPFAIPLLPISALIFTGGLVTSIATSVFSFAESIFRKAFCCSRRADDPETVDVRQPESRPLQAPRERDEVMTGKRSDFGKRSSHDTKLFGARANQNCGKEERQSFGLQRR